MLNYMNCTVQQEWCSPVQCHVRLSFNSYDKYKEYIMKVGFQGGSKMYRVEWIDSEGDIRTIKGFKTNVEAREYINQMSKYFDKFAYPEVFWDNEQRRTKK